MGASIQSATAEEDPFWLIDEQSLDSVIAKQTTEGMTINGQTSFGQDSFAETPTEHLLADPITVGNDTVDYNYEHDYEHAIPTIPHATNHLDSEIVVHESFGDNAAFIRPHSQWYGDVDFLSMERRDSITFRDYAYPSERATLESGTNTGVRLRINHDAARTNQPRSSSHADLSPQPTFHFSLMQIDGSGDAFLPSERLSTSTSLTNIAIAAGTTHRVLGGQRRIMIGGRWMNIGDLYRSQVYGYTPLQDWIETENKIVTFDLDFEQQYLWRKFVFSTGVCSGFGWNQSTQINHYAPTLRNRLVEASYLAFVTELNADVSFHVTRSSAFHVGLSALSIGDVYNARDVAAGQVDPDRLEMYGMTFGYRHRF
ncbi:hypothetical protein Pla22_30820 [Rubripirellula amarantea]|uniref:Uncharacterized protein n=2 Tax=Rubripirellula amarantea TaxID=2527999 RepID=A0A5C5WI40_9BACT|nr:hypothetical protein Pla22_30820 [Rubripirellula amarantea]